MSVDQVYLKPGNQGVIQRGGNLLFLVVSVLLSVKDDRTLQFIATRFNDSFQEEIIRVEVTIETGGNGPESSG